MNTRITSIKSILLFSFVAFLSLAVSAQNSIGFNVGLSSYEGDLHCFEEPEQNIINSAGISFGIHLRKELSKYFAGRLALQYARFQGDDRDFALTNGHNARAFDFTNNMVELTARIDLEPWKEKVFSPFVSVGAGIASNNPSTNFDFSNKTTSVQDLILRDQDELKRIIFAVPVSAGFNIRATELITVGLEAGLRLGVSDYLDGVAISAPTSQYSDYMGTAAVTLNYRLGGLSINSAKVGSKKVTKGDKTQMVPATAAPATPDEDAIRMKALRDKEAELEKRELRIEKAAEEATLAAEKAAMSAKEAAATLAKIESESKDSDNDGVLDRLDACPSIYAKTASGCPETSVSSDVLCTAVFGTKSVRFKTSFADLSGEDKATLQSVIDILNNCPDKKVMIEGHTDSQGSEMVNQDLSNNRARAVKNYLVKQGIDTKRIMASGYGETRPIADNGTKEGRTQNRRVEIILN